MSEPSTTLICDLCLYQAAWCVCEQTETPIPIFGEDGQPL